MTTQASKLRQQFSQLLKRLFTPLRSRLLRLFIPALSKQVGSVHPTDLSLCSRPKMDKWAMPTLRICLLPQIDFIPSLLSWRRNLLRLYSFFRPRPPLLFLLTLTLTLTLPALTTPSFSLPPSPSTLYPPDRLRFSFNSSTLRGDTANNGRDKAPDFIPPVEGRRAPINLLDLSSRGGSPLAPLQKGGTRPVKVPLLKENSGGSNHPLPLKVPLLKGDLGGSPTIIRARPNSIESPLTSFNLPADELIDQGKAFYADGQFTQAAASWRQAAAAYANQGDGLGQAMALTYLSLARQQLSHWTEAESAIDASLDLLTQYPEGGGAGLRSQLYAQALNARGRLSFALGRLETAFRTWEQATNAYRLLDDQTGVAGSLINQAQALETLGLYRRSCHTILTALGVDARCDRLDSDTLTNVLQTIQAHPDPKIQILGLRSLGVMLRLVDNLERSSQVLQAGLAIAKQRSSLQDTSATWLALGETERARYQQVKESVNNTNSDDVEKIRTAAQAGIDAYQQAALLVQSAGKSSSTFNLIQTQAQLQRLSLLLDLQAWLRAHQQTSDPEKAQIQLLVQALLTQQLTDLPPSRPTVYAQLNLARSLFQLSQIDGVDPVDEYTETALKLASAALTAATELEDGRGESYALGGLGGLYEQLQDWPQALAFTQSALARAQTAQADDMSYQWQWQLGRIYAAQAQTEPAIDAYRQALNTLQTPAPRSGVPESRRAIFLSGEC